MANLKPLSADALGTQEEAFRQTRDERGWVANSTLTMARRPEILDAFRRLFRATMGPGTVDQGLKQMVAEVASTSAGCRYCQAHTATAARRLGVQAEKIAELYDFERSEHFDDGERAALRLARDSAIVPNAVTPEHFAALAEHFDEAQVCELVGAVAMFGFLNRWNDTIGTELEDVPFEFASDHLTSGGWQAGKHRA